MIDLLYLDPGDQWDQFILKKLFADELYRHGLTFKQHADYPDSDGLVIVIPGRYWYDKTKDINKQLARYKWVLAIRTGDEEDLFDIAQVEHPNIRWWVQTPRTDRDYGEARLFGVGYPPHFAQMPAKCPEADIDVFLSAQNTHTRRREAFNALQDVRVVHSVTPTSGFTKGLKPEDYRDTMLSTKIAPAPSGAFSPDSFRLYEALEAHCVPIADDISPQYDSAGYWRKLYPDAPFPILEDYESLPGYIDDQLKLWPANANRIAAWWMRQKRRFSEWLSEDLSELGALTDHPVTLGDLVTVVITCSPIKSHPSTEIVEETIRSVREQLPACEIVLVHDGVRPEQEDRRSDYELYLRRVLWLADHQWGNVTPVIYDEHLHQASAVKRALHLIRTPLMLFVEQDTPLCGEIDWDGCADAIIDAHANMIRYSHEASILDVHRHLMLDDEPRLVGPGQVPMTRTVQYSQRPHLASVAFYRHLLDTYFDDNYRYFIEDRLHGKLAQAYNVDGVLGWNNWRTWLYTPEGDIKRSYHTDGRAGESKF